MKKHPGVAVATSSTLAADAARDLAAAGGNAVDCAIAASLIAMNTEPGVCALAGGAYVTIGVPGDAPVTIDGGVGVPGKNLASPADDGVPLRMAYGGGVDTIVGCASVGVPGTVAALASASERFGRLPWRALFEPVIRAAEHGFPLPNASHYYLKYSGEPIFARSADGRAALFDEQGALYEAGTKIRVPHLADTLRSIATDGADAFYRGWIAEALTTHIAAGRGSLTRSDLADYRAIERPALELELEGWRLGLNPPPAVGGAVLSSLLLLTARGLGSVGRDIARINAELAKAQFQALEFRRKHLDLSEDVGADTARLLALSRSGRLPPPGASSATVHTSAVDASGLACAITSSAGYGSGEMPEGTGLWLNNCLGELELNRRGLSAGPPGARLPSNMCPGVGRLDDTVLAFGSPGADRITTALQQVLVRHLLLGRPLDRAIRDARMHAEIRDPLALSVEEGLDTTCLDFALNSYPAESMYFGGVAAARCDGIRLSAAADPRRAGGTYISQDWEDDSSRNPDA